MEATTSKEPKASVRDSTTWVHDDDDYLFSGIQDEVSERRKF